MENVERRGPTAILTQTLAVAAALVARERKAGMAQTMQASTLTPGVPAVQVWCLRLQELPSDVRAVAEVCPYHGALPRITGVA